MSEDGVTISFKEIYDEVLKTSKTMDNLVDRVEKIEKSLETQEDRHQKFRTSIQLQVIGAILGILVSGLTFYLFK